MPAPRFDDTVVVIAGGERLDRRLLSVVPTTTTVIAADSGAQRAHEIGIGVDDIVGDLDSLTPALTEELADAGARVHRHPVHKDATDLELAIRLARDHGARAVRVLGGHGGRADHFLGNVALLCSDATAELAVDAWLGPDHLLVVRDRVELSGWPGDLVSLLAMHGPARQVTTTGLAYPLHGEDLTPGTSRGLSNALVESSATVAVAGGVLAVIRPRALAHLTRSMPGSSR